MWKYLQFSWVKYYDTKYWALDQMLPSLVAWAEDSSPMGHVFEFDFIGQFQRPISYDDATAELGESGMLHAK